ncbi:glycoside hydrolase family 13 protein [Candidatus Aquiluna sp. UB-MaderosW2red]|uniref:glycoside hydrolase family 13 protein n=1 Tax=Candidatus Aquiluna sp. UB-MaderosW2red TaxID=1855377 RepID=UPI000875AD25|nr:glycoside hydrolase family 13 protein [Candidatus Aquiluna sp. UB-MaderosW2red]SCX15590.1 alpha-glucosidase [Candidatus Aquiluna sp. UB-MaderosW2red]
MAVINHLAHTPHHDGSTLYVRNQSPKVGEKLKLKVRIHSSLGKVSQVLIRQSDSGENFLAPKLKKIYTRHGWDWYEGSIEMFNPQVHYRFFIELEDNSSFWLNPLGLHEIDQPDRDDFKINTHPKAPKWATGSVLYQVFPDRFARSTAAAKRELPDWAIPKAWGDEVIGQGPGTSQQLFGGDLKGVEEHLDHLKKLGASILYLTPFFPAGSNHRYDSSSFTQVDPLLGGNKALSDLVKKAHSMGLKVMGDLTANHSGDKHEWFQAAYRNPKAPESEFYYFTNKNSEYDSWWGVKSLPKFNWNSAELKRRFILGKQSVVARWLKAPFELDGWRIDVANMTGKIRGDDFNQEVARTIKNTMDEINPDTFLIGEFTSDAANLVQGDSYQSTMTYANFTRPTWRWLWDPSQELEENQMGPGRKGISGTQFMQLHQSFAGTFPWQLRMHNLNALDTHDTGRFKTFAIQGAQRVAAGLQFTFPGIPMIFAGDEFGLDGYNGENSRTPIPWNNERPFDSSMISTYSTLAALRKKHRALVEGSMRWLYTSKEAMVFIRESKTESILVIAARGKDRKIEFPKDSLSGAENAENLFGNGVLKVVGGKIRYESVALDLQIWRLPSAHR